MNFTLFPTVRIGSQRHSCYVVNSDRQKVNSFEVMFCLLVFVCLSFKSASTSTTALISLFSIIVKNQVHNPVINAALFTGKSFEILTGFLHFSQMQLILFN